MTVPTIVLAPYSPALWRNALPPGFRLIPLPIPTLPCLSRMATDVLVNAPSSFAVIGFCLGGVLALELARQATDRLRGIALINGTAAQDTPLAAHIRGERIAKLESKLVGQAFPDSAYLDHAVPWLLSAASRRRPSTREEARGLLAEIPLATSLAQQRAMVGRPDGRPLLAILDMPTLFIGGREDRICKPELTTEMGLLAKRGRAILFDDCGHMVPIEDPIRTRHHLTVWLRQI